MGHRYARIPVRAANARSLGAKDLRVLIAIAAHADRDGRAFPSQGRIAALAGMDRRNVSGAVTRLEAAGLLRRDRRKTAFGDADSTVYTILYSGDEVSSTGMTPAISEHDTVSCPAMTGCHAGECTEHTNQTNQGTTQQHPGRERFDSGQVAKWFEAFWQAYPSRRPYSNPKAPAQKSFYVALQRDVDAALIIRAAENYRATVEREGTNPRYVAQAVTWLNQARWEDYQQEPEPRRLRAGMI
ncbi:MAG TPA: helix-turn-helix domain-containing protein [Stellaceae bacterium]|nr:helix-turn-helix domain-containing protein [Stellaceae bacterium]